MTDTMCSKPMDAVTSNKILTQCTNENAGQHREEQKLSSFFAKNWRFQSPKTTSLNEILKFHNKTTMLDLKREPARIVRSLKIGLVSNHSKV